MTLHSHLLPSSARYAFIASTVLAVLALASCSKEAAKPAASQVAAKVNKEEISVHQINFALQRQQGVRPEQAEAAGRQVLERLIEQEIAVQKAQEQKLDRDPRVMQEIEAARREIIARAYLGKVSDSASRPSTEEIRAYYDSKPALFRERRIYTLQEVVIDGDSQQIAELQAFVAQAKSLQQVAEFAKARKLPTRTTQNTTAAESLPLQLLDRIAALKGGQTAMVATPGGVRMLTLLQAQDAPVTEEQARPAIEQYLMNDRKRSIVEQDLKSIRSAAHIEYIGQFANKPADAASASAAAAAKPTAAAASSVLDSDAINKGLAGLK
jgi:EpsD family peptidyl-prolyl cis-trans isomerase